MFEADNGPKLPLKVVINRQKSKVLFAEANSDVADILLSFLALPLGKIVRILEKHYGNETPAIGSLNTLYRGLLNLDSNHFCDEGCKQMLVNPAIASENELLLRSLQLDFSKDDRQPAQYFSCQGSCSKSSANICMYSHMASCDCGKPLNRKVEVRAESLTCDARDGGVLATNLSSFIICDDLRFVPKVTGFLQTLNNLGITDLDGAEPRSVSFGINDIMDLLKLSFISATPLTDLVIKKSEMVVGRSQPRYFVHQVEEASSRKMGLKIYLQRSSDKFLFAEATHEFVKFLFSFLTLPLGGVEHILGGSTNLKSIDNLYKSLQDLSDDKYFTSPNSKYKLINPKLAHGYTSQNQYLAFTEETLPKLFLITQIPHYNRSEYFPIYNNEITACNGKERTLVTCLKWGKGHGNYVKEEAICIVSDDLTVTPSTISSAISTLNAMGIRFSDVKEMDFHIGLEEALRILKASLTSRTALTDALIKPMLKNGGLQPKQEP